MKGLDRSARELSVENCGHRVGRTSSQLRNTRELTTETYPELIRIAAHIFRQENPGHVLEPVALVNEAVARMLRNKTISWKNRSHFVGVAAHLMRQVLIDYARWRDADKRFGKYPHVELTSELVNRSVTLVDHLETLLVVHAALERLEKFAPRLAQIALLRFFWGFTISEVASALGVGVTTVKEEWKMASTWLRRTLD